MSEPFSPLGPGHLPVAITGATGYRGSVAARIMTGGRTSAVPNVVGGTSAWVTSGYPVAPRREATGVQAIGVQAIGVQAIGVQAIGVQAIGVQAMQGGAR